uniref:Cationic amino acid transporter n=1 Tax=Parasteatoda tepidariorum TaxID=114398 RepID=A0A2L2YB38_PARTP
MGLINWFQDCWILMMRTKPQYLSVLGRKRSSIRSPSKTNIGNETDGGMSMSLTICLIVMCCSLSFGVVLLLIEDVVLNASTLLIPLIIASICAVTGGLCLAEYISQQSQEVPSIYSCCYQYSSEVLAFFIGWSWLFSQSAMVATFCKILVLFVNHWTDNALLKTLEKTFSVYADAIPCIIFILAVSIFIFTGFGETAVWYIVFIPIGFLLLVIAIALSHLANKDAFSYGGSWLQIKSIDMVLTGSCICLLFFIGPQSILRVSQKQVKQKVTVTLGLLNFIAFFILLVLLTTSFQSGKILDLQMPPTNPLTLAINIILVICICIMTVEAFYPLYFLIEDMSSDGLLFRNFTKKWKPCCFPVASATVQLLTVLSIIVLDVFLSLKQLLALSVLFPLIVHTLIPLLVLNQRYRDNTSWQYEPMFQTTARNLRDRSRKKSEEFQYTNGIGFDNNDNLEMSTTCISENDSESDTDIDSVVKQYKDQAKIANMPILEEHGPSDQIPEPTPASAFRAKLCIGALFLTSTVNAVALNLAHLDHYFVFGIIVLVCILFSTVVQGMLLYLPQNRTSSNVCCTMLPWTPGMAALIATCLSLHCLLMVWRIYLGWILLGSLVYFLYGVRSSTAANSFHNLRTSHIALKPLPSYGNNCVTQIVPSQRKSLKQKNVKRKILM